MAKSIKDNLMKRGSTVKELILTLMVVSIKATSRMVSLTVEALKPGLMERNLQEISLMENVLVKVTTNTQTVVNT